MVGCFHCNWWTYGQLITTLDDRINAIQQTRDEWRTQVATRLLDITGALAKLYNEQGETLRRVDEFMAGK
jgi:hypothetical protein